MDLKIIEKKEEPLLSRTKVISEANFDAATPSEKEVKSKIASSLKADENLIVVRNIYTDFGFKKAGITAYLYKDEKDMHSFESKPKKQKEGKPEKPEAVSGEAKEEKPKEQKAGAKTEAKEIKKEDSEEK